MKRDNRCAFQECAVLPLGKRSLSRLRPCCATLPRGRQTLWVVTALFVGFSPGVQATEQTKDLALKPGEESIEGFLQSLETQGIDKLTMEKLSQVHDLNKRLEEVLTVEQKISNIQKLRRERQSGFSSDAPVGGTDKHLDQAQEDFSGSPPKRPRSVAPVLPARGYAIQKVFKKNGVFEAVLIDAEGRTLDVKQGALLPSGEKVKKISLQHVLVASSTVEHPLPFVLGTPSSSSRGIKREKRPEAHDPHTPVPDGEAPESSQRGGS